MNLRFDEHIATIAKVTNLATKWHYRSSQQMKKQQQKKKFILLSIRFSHLWILIPLHRPSVTPRLSGGGLKHKYRQESRLEISFELLKEKDSVSACWPVSTSDTLLFRLAYGLFHWGATDREGQRHMTLKSNLLHIFLPMLIAYSCPLISGNNYIGSKRSKEL